MMEILLSVLLGSVGALALWGLYRALQLNWPEQYASLNDTFALRVNQTWWRFLLYRFVPVFGAGVALWATAGRLKLHPIVTIVTMVVIHLLHTNAIALAQSFGKLQARQKFTINYASYHLMAIGLVALAATGSVIFGASLAFLVPKPSVLLENLWVAIFIAIAGGVALSVIGRRPDGARTFDPQYFVWRADRDVGIELSDIAYKAAMDYRCDPILLRSIMFAEALQRPRWVRNIERVKGVFFKRGTYGVTQESADQPISDEEAIHRTARSLSHCWAVTLEEWGFAGNDGLIWKHSAHHNEDVRFIAGVQEIYRSLSYSPQSMAYELESRELKILEVRRYPHRFGMRAVTSANVLSFSYTSASGDLAQTRIERPEDVPQAELWAFELSFDVDVSLISAVLTGPGGLASYEIPVNAATV